MATGRVYHELYMWLDAGRGSRHRRPAMAAGVGALREPGDQAALPEPRRGRRSVRRPRSAQAADGHHRRDP